MDDSGIGSLIALAFAIAAVIFIVYCIILITGAIVAIAGTGGVLWGGGTAVVNYCKSFKENMIDGNRAAA